MSKCLKFCPAQGLKFKADFHSKMSVCRHELGVSTPTPRQFQPWSVESENRKLTNREYFRSILT